MFCYLVWTDLVVVLYPLIQTFIKAHLADSLIWQSDSTAKGSKKNTPTPPNVIRLQYVGEFMSYISTYSSDQYLLKVIY